MYINPVSEMIKVNTLVELKNNLNHPYRMGEFIVKQDGEVLEVPETDEEMIELLEDGFVHYGINYEDDSLYFENGKQVPMVYGNN